MPLPHFIIGGAPRSGTTWLYSLADAHPAIAMAKPMRPEPKFFLRNDLYARGLRYYEDTWFQPLPGGRVLGEKSANYLESSETAARIRHDLPGVKLVFVLRDPVRRAYSNYQFSRENGLETETFEHALELEESRTRDLPEELRFTRPFSYFARGLYADMLAPWLDLFPRSQLLILRTEDIEASPESVAGRFYDFVGVSGLPGLAERLGVVNATKEHAADSELAALEDLRKRYAEPNKQLQILLGPSFTVWS